MLYRKILANDDTIRKPRGQRTYGAADVLVRTLAMAAGWSVSMARKIHPAAAASRGKG